MLAHKCLEKNLIDLVVGGPIVAYNVISNCLNKLFMQVIVCSLLLNVRIGIAD